jgi:hypothetical protein
MKKLLFVSFLFFCVNTVFTQNEKRKNLKTLKIAYLTSELDLTTTEAEKFWPIYNTNAQKQLELKNKYRELRNKTIEDYTSINNSEAIQVLKKLSSIENEIYNIRDNMSIELIDVITAKKVILLRKAEEDFNRKLIKKYKNSHKKRTE